MNSKFAKHLIVLINTFKVLLNCANQEFSISKFETGIIIDATKLVKI